MVQRTGRSVAGLELQITPTEQKEHEHGERIEPDLIAPRPRGVECGGRAGHEGHDDAHGHGRVHADALQFEVAPSALKERPAGEKHHRQTQDPTGPAQQLVNVGGDVTGFGHIGGPRVHHHLHHAKTGHEQAPQGFAGFGQALADGQGLLEGQQAVTGLAYGLSQTGQRSLCGVPLQDQAARGRVHLGRSHAGHALQGAFDSVGTGRAIHALHHQHRLQATLRVAQHGLGEVGLLDSVV